MKTKIAIYAFACLLMFHSCQPKNKTNLDQIFLNPPESASNWVLWYWIKAGVSKEGITADLEAMKEMGIAGAHLVPVQGPDDPPVYEPPIVQLTPEWWEMIEFALQEAKRLGLKIAMHSCDGFAVAGGPWIKPEMSMQKLVWSKTNISGGKVFSDSLPQPETIEDYYKDVAVFAYPIQKGSAYSTEKIKPNVSSNLTTENINYLADVENTKAFRSNLDGWIQYKFDEPFTCRSILINANGANYASNRLIVESSMDGIHFDSICRLKPARHGWQDYEYNYTHSIPTTTARFFRFSHIKDRFEPGSEDMDRAKWSPNLSILGISLSGEAKIHQYNSKNGLVWRIAIHTTNEQVNNALCITKDSILDITSNYDANGILTWKAPPGEWTILRMGHTSTGHTNYIGGGGLGLECDKFNPEIVSYQFDNWFGKVFEKVGNDLAQEVLKVFYMDSWECGSQNWSTVFADEFKKRRGYDIIPYLPVFAGLPVESIEQSERVLYDIRNTIAELVVDNFFGTMALRAKEKDCTFASESVAPVMISDNLEHHKLVDIPMCEFWFNSPTHDKPVDVLDAISAAHIYGKNIVQSEAFTTLRMDWNEHPGMLKTLGDRNFALGVNRYAFHVFSLNPWVDKQPGMTLNTVGLYFQRDQTWWKHGKAWMEYLERCNAMLQQGKPVVDLAVFTGEEFPRRSITPDRLINTLPGLFNDEIKEREEQRIKNTGVPMIERPYSIRNAANTYDPAKWLDPLNGYKYDSFNKDALLNLAKVKDGKIILEGGQEYQILVIPAPRKSSPNNLISIETADKLCELIEVGATIIVEKRDTTNILTFNNTPSNSIKKLFHQDAGVTQKPLGKGKIIYAPYFDSSLKEYGIEHDLIAYENELPAKDIAWTHRNGNGFDIYFISNQKQEERTINFSFRVSDKQPRIFNPVSEEIVESVHFTNENGRTIIPLKLAANESVFVVFQESTKQIVAQQNWKTYTTIDTLNTKWKINFSKDYKGVHNTIELQQLSDWSRSDNDSIKYFSGTATYTNTFTFDSQNKEEIWLDLGTVKHTAEIFVNNQSCGIVWTHPYRINITDAIQNGDNTIKIDVTNTWKNRIIGDNTIFKDDPFTFTTAPFRIAGQPLIESGLIGPVQLQIRE